MKLFLNVAIAAGILASAALAQSPVTLTVDTQTRLHPIAPDFGGVSIFTGTQVAGHRGMPGSLFSGTNTQLIMIFKNSGIHHLRLGASGAGEGSSNLNHESIDSLFAFAKATGIKVIYSLHAADGVATARYVWTNYKPCLDCFAFDNEPDKRMSGGDGALVADYKAYLEIWRAFAQSVTNAIPGAKFTGLDAAGRNITPRFAADEKDSGMIVFITQHIYVGGNSLKQGIDVSHAIEKMLSRDWITNRYARLNREVLRPVAKEGFTVRLTESDDFTHGVTGASDAFASALWGLDYMHWCAAHGARGVNFQNSEWLATDTFHPDAHKDYQANPKAYAIRAFDLGGQGSTEPVAVENADGLNLTAYAVGEASTLCVTIINKGYGAGAKDASVTIVPKGFVATRAETISLTAPNGDAEATNGITLGGASITNNAEWRGHWTALGTVTNNQCTVTVPAASAVVVKMSTRRDSERAAGKAPN